MRLQATRACTLFPYTTLFRSHFLRARRLRERDAPIGSRFGSLKYPRLGAIKGQAARQSYSLVDGSANTCSRWRGRRCEMRLEATRARCEKTRVVECSSSFLAA